AVIRRPRKTPAPDGAANPGLTCGVARVGEGGVGEGAGGGWPRMPRMVVVVVGGSVVVVTMTGGGTTRRRVGREMGGRAVVGGGAAVVEGAGGWVVGDVRGMVTRLLGGVVGTVRWVTGT